MREIYKHYKGSKQVIVFIHGIAEGPNQFRRLAQIAYSEGYSVYLALLPGHGKCAKAFYQTDCLEWCRYISYLLQRLEKRYEHIILVGHSMGALLAINEVAAGKIAIQAIVLIDCPIYVHLRFKVIYAIISIMHGKYNRDKYTLAEYRAISIAASKESDYLKCVTKYMELAIMIYYTKKRIRYVSIPTLLFFGVKDEFVALKSKEYFNKPNMFKVILRDSGHFCYHHTDLLKLENIFRAFISKQKDKSDK